jgi:hypothetical protein
LQKSISAEASRHTNMGMTTEIPSGIAFTLLIILIFKCLVKFENFKEDNV